MYGNTVKALREKRAEVFGEMRKMTDKIHAENRDFTAEERAAFETADKDYNALTARIAHAELMDQRAADQARVVADPTVGRDAPPGDGTRNSTPTVTPEHRALALQAWMRAQRGLDLRPEHDEACRLTGTNPRRPELEVALPSRYSAVRRELQQRALGVNTFTAGNALVPEGFVSNLEIALLQFGSVRQVADVMRTESGQDLPWPTVNDTNNKGSILVENQQVQPLDLKFAQTVFHAYKYTSGLILVSAELLEDSAFNLAEEIGSLAGIRIGRIQSDHFTFGTGAAQPMGFVTACLNTSIGGGAVTTASTGKLVADDLYTLKHSVDPAYRAMGGGWMLHDKILLAIKQLKDGMGRYLWQMGLAPGRPDTIDGDPVYVNQSMDSTVATGKNVLAYGHWPKYKIRDVASVRMRRLVERYADFDQEGFVMFSRHDGNLLDAGTHPLKVLQVS